MIFIYLFKQYNNRQSKIKYNELFEDKFDFFPRGKWNVNLGVSSLCGKYSGVAKIFLKNEI